MRRNRPIRPSRPTLPPNQPSLTSRRLPPPIHSRPNRKPSLHARADAADLRSPARRAGRLDRDRRPGDAGCYGRDHHRLESAWRGGRRTDRRFRRRAGRATEARRLSDRAARDRTGHDRRQFGGDGCRFRAGRHERPGAGAGRAAGCAEQADHRACSEAGTGKACRSGGCASSAGRTRQSPATSRWLPWLRPISRQRRLSRWARPSASRSRRSRSRAERYSWPVRRLPARRCASTPTIFCSATPRRRPKAGFCWRPSAI